MHFVVRFCSLILVLILLVSCTQRYSTRKKSQKSVQVHTEKIINHQNKKVVSSKEVLLEKSKKTISQPSENTTNTTIQLMLNTALSYLGTPYKYTGITHNGMDCSGLMYVCFQAIDVQLNRSAEQMSEQGVQVSIQEVRKGDLLFFRTSKRKKINHVGMVVEVENGVQFIHSSTSKGVVISRLSDPYWKKSFVKAKRIF